MTIEQTSIRIVQKPWGSNDLRPWSDSHGDGSPIGELWYERTGLGAPAPALLLKLLFTTEALSIQVHPDDAFAQTIGQPHGKTEAWYILGAEPGAQVAVGLKQQITTPQLRAAIEDGSIVDLVEWHAVAKGDVVFIPAGTIHAIGPGLVIAEIQQQSDTTFRLFDYGRTRELHVDNAVAIARTGPAACQVVPQHLTGARTVLATCPYFVLEQLDLPPNSSWELRAKHETWLLVLEGRALIGPLNTVVGEAVYLKGGSASVETGRNGLKGLLAYATAKPDTGLLHARRAHGSAFRSIQSNRPALHHGAAAKTRAQ